MGPVSYCEIESVHRCQVALHPMDVNLRAVSLRAAASGVSKFHDPKFVKANFSRLISREKPAEALWQHAWRCYWLIRHMRCTKKWPEAGKEMTNRGNKHSCLTSPHFPLRLACLCLRFEDRLGREQTPREQRSGKFAWSPISNSNFQTTISACMRWMQQFTNDHCMVKVQRGLERGIWRKSSLLRAALKHESQTKLTQGCSESSKLLFKAAASKDLQVRSWEREWGATTGCGTS